MSRELTKRQEAILKLIIEQYVETAEPVGSTTLANAGVLDVSSATIRNEMAELETCGLIRQPHTSAGRIPTEQGYAYFLRHFVHTQQLTRHEDKLRKALDQARAREEAFKSLAKMLVELSGEMAIISFNPHWNYYTGVSNLFQKPDFSELEHVRSLSELIDSFDEVLQELFDRVSSGPQVMIGSESPFGQDMAAIFVKQQTSKDRVSLFGLVGPLRMDYEKNIGLMEEAKAIIDQEMKKTYGGQE